MKKILLSVCFLATSIFAFAQKPAEGDHAFTFGLSGINNLGVSTPTFTGSLLFKHYLKDNLAARVGINFGNSSSHYIYNQQIAGGDSIKANKSSSNFGITLGMQYSFKGTDRLETYIGADIYFNKGSSKGDTTETQTTNLGGGITTKHDYSGSNTNPSITKIGFIPCVGLNYYFTDWLAVGAEFGWGFISTSYGQQTSTGTATDATTVSGTTTTTTSTTTSAGSTLKSSGFSTISHGMITVTAAFR